MCSQDAVMQSHGHRVAIKSPACVSDCPGNKTIEKKF